MNEAAESYPIVIGIDFSELGFEALRQALELASTIPGAEPHVVHVTTGLGPLVTLELGRGEVREVTAREAEAQLQRFVDDELVNYEGAKEPIFERAVVHLRVGAAASEIVKLANDLDAQLIVVGTSGPRGISRLFQGSVAEEILHQAPCPVLVVRRGPANDEELTSPSFTTAER
jgi:nucleotide-binding universal stress UspA family protein